MNDIETFKIELKKRINWPFTIFLGLWLIIWIAIFGTIFYGLITTPNRIGDLVFVVILGIIIGLWVVDRFLWQISGVELLIITNKIELIKKGKLYKSCQKIDFLEYESVSFDEDIQTPFWIKLYGLKGGKIIINYLGHKVRFGQDTSISYAEIAANEIDKEIKNRIYNYA